MKQTKNEDCKEIGNIVDQRLAGTDETRKMMMKCRKLSFLRNQKVSPTFLHGEADLRKCTPSGIKRHQLKTLNGPFELCLHWESCMRARWAACRSGGEINSKSLCNCCTKMKVWREDGCRPHLSFFSLCLRSSKWRARFPSALAHHST